MKIKLKSYRSILSPEGRQQHSIICQNFVLQWISNRHIKLQLCTGPREEKCKILMTTHIEFLSSLAPSGPVDC